jgi:translation elongation factor EF-1beta
MPDKPKYEILDSLPATGPMYIPVAEGGEKFYQEGFVVRFYKSNGDEWVANFKSGWTDFSYVKELSNHNIIVIANGMGYVMNRDKESPIATFGLTIRQILQINEDEFITFDDTHAEIVNAEGVKWTSERISWDGFEDIELRESIIFGMSYDPMNIEGKLVAFTLDLNTLRVEGGSYQAYETTPGLQKKWWQFWQ